MPRPSTVTSVDRATFPLNAEQLYLIVSDFYGHHVRIIPSIISKSTYRVTGGPDLGSIMIEGTMFEGGKDRMVRLTVEEIEPGAAYRLVEANPGRTLGFRVIPLSSSESILEVSASARLSGEWRDLIRKMVVSQVANRTCREILENVRRYSQTLGSTITGTHDTVRAYGSDGPE